MPDRSKLPIHRVDSLIDILNEKLAYKNLSNNTDFNNINETGFFKFTISDGSVNLNQPIMNQNNKTYNVFCSIYDVNKTIGIQIVYSREQLSFPIYCRIKENNNWLPWYQIAGSGLDMPSKKFIEFTPPISGQIYTAPANGYIYFAKLSGNANERIALQNETSLLKSSIYSSASNQNLAVYIPVNRNDSVTFLYTVSGNTDKCRFIYANSEVPMNER
jgi:hypothetical protein